jgi:hypothetical protein
MSTLGAALLAVTVLLGVAEAAGGAAAQPQAGATVDQPPLPEQPNSGTGYPTVAAALAGLHAKPGVVFSVRNGWTVATDDGGSTLWSFPPPGHPAYPSAVKRRIVQTADGGWSIGMAVQCGGTKQACDDLVRSFQQLNAAMRARLMAGPQ